MAINVATNAETGHPRLDHPNEMIPEFMQPGYGNGVTFDSPLADGYVGAVAVPTSSMSVSISRQVYVTHR